MSTEFEMKRPVISIPDEDDCVADLKFAEYLTNQLKDSSELQFVEMRVSLDELGFNPTSFCLVWCVPLSGSSESYLLYTKSAKLYGFDVNIKTGAISNFKSRENKESYEEYFSVGKEFYAKHDS